MEGFALFATAVAISMDALAAAAATGSMLSRANIFQALKVGLCFGLFQALMPAIGLVAGRGVREWMQMLDHWAAFGLLAVTGLGMIREELRDCTREECKGDPMRWGRLLTLGAATSMDALAVGISLAVTGEYSVQHALVIGLTTFALCTPGVMLGGRLQSMLHRRAGVVGGLMLLLIGVKILVEHLVKGI